jgi:hypothetical protein
LYIKSECFINLDTRENKTRGGAKKHKKVFDTLNKKIK